MWERLRRWWGSERPGSAPPPAGPIGSSPPPDPPPAPPPDAGEVLRLVERHRAGALRRERLELAAALRDPAARAAVLAEPALAGPFLAREWRDVDASPERPLRLVVERLIARDRARAVALGEALAAACVRRVVAAAGPGLSGHPAALARLYLAWHEERTPERAQAVNAALRADPYGTLPFIAVREYAAGDWSAAVHLAVRDLAGGAPRSWSGLTEAIRATRDSTRDDAALRAALREATLAVVDEPFSRASLGDPAARREVAPPALDPLPLAGSDPETLERAGLGLVVRAAETLPPDEEPTAAAAALVRAAAALAAGSGPAPGEGDVARLQALLGELASRTPAGREAEQRIQPPLRLCQEGLRLVLFAAAARDGCADDPPVRTVTAIFALAGADEAVRRALVPWLLGVP